jgi:outer membrane protein OmpA-like peptidoglycan-associated protein
MPAGFYMGTGLSWNAPRYWDWQVRIGYHGRGRMQQPRSFASSSPDPLVRPSIELPDSAPAAEAPRAAVVPAPPPAPAAPPVQESRAAQAAPAPRDYSFDDVYFDLDGYTLRPEATPVLDEAAQAMRADPTLTLNIEGHTCDLGTAEYNLALADRRATTVRNFFVSRGIPASRLRTASYGEEDPEHANVHEETRRLNRRVALVVRLQP